MELSQACYRSATSAVGRGDAGTGRQEASWTLCLSQHGCSYTFIAHLQEIILFILSSDKERLMLKTHDCKL